MTYFLDQPIRRRTSPFVASSQRAFANAFMWVCIAAALGAAAYAASQPEPFTHWDPGIFGDGLRGLLPVQP